MGAVDNKFDCATSLQIVFAFALIGAALASAMALITRLALIAVVPLGSVRRECVSALIAATALVLGFYAIVHWNIGMSLPVPGRMAIWAVLSVVVCALSVLAGKRIASRREATELRAR